MASLDEFIKMANNLSELQRQRDAVQKQVEDAQQVLNATVNEAEQKGRDLIEQAHASANTIYQAAQIKQKELAQREADVETREQAVAWVDVKLKELGEREQQLAQSLKEAEAARINAQAQQQHWSEKLGELQARDEAITKREQAVVNA